MALITDIAVPVRGSRARVLWADHAEWLTTSADVLGELEVLVGHVEPADELAARINQAAGPLARVRALHLLAYRDRSRAELSSRLAQDGYTDEVTAATVDSLVNAGIVDDSRYAAFLAHSLADVRGYGVTRVRAELLAKGLEPSLVEEALATVTDDEREAERAAQLAHAIVVRTGPDVDRLAMRLVRKGFRPAVALRAARAAVEALPPTDGDS